MSSTSLPAQAQATTPAPESAPDVVVFTNGDQLSGKLERGIGNSIVFKSDMAGEITHACFISQRSLPKVLQVKEKVGVLRVYVRDGDEAIHAAITRAELRSAITCELCGEAAQLRSQRGWVRTLCLGHWDEPTPPCKGTSA